MIPVHESSHVGVLLDIGKVRFDLEKEAVEGGQEGFGRGLHDGTSRNSSRAELAARQIIDHDPMSWYNLVAAQLALTAGAETDDVLTKDLTHLGALIVAWIEDIKRRSGV